MSHDNPIYRCEGYIVSVFSWLRLHFVGEKNKKKNKKTKPNIYFFI